MATTRPPPSDGSDLKVDNLRFERTNIKSETTTEPSTAAKGFALLLKAIELTPESSPEPEVEPVKKKRKIRQKECDICCNDIPLNRFPLNPHKFSYKHGRGVCFVCWEAHLHTELDNNKTWDTLSCAQCEHVMQLDEIMKLDRSFTRRVEPRMMAKAAKALCDTDDKFVPCPSSTCSFGAYMQDGDLFTCQVCKLRYCFTCKVTMHEGKTCTQHQDEAKRNDDKNREEELSSALLKEKYKACPKCHTQLDKYIGCDHVFCKNEHCKFEFCWSCFAPHAGPMGINRVGNSAHEDSCRHHSSRLPAYYPATPVETPHFDI